MFLAPVRELEFGSSGQVYGQALRLLEGELSPEEPPFHPRRWDVDKICDRTTQVEYTTPGSTT